MDERAAGTGRAAGTERAAGTGRAAEFDGIVSAESEPATEPRPGRGPGYGPQPSHPEPTGSRLDDAWQRWAADPRIRRIAEWGAPAAVLAVATATRLVGLDHPHQIVFDETYYVKDAYTLSNLGYESRWPEDANTSFAAGDPDVYSTDASFVVHPPLGKWIIAAGMAAFGTDSAFGWRVGIAVVGILLVALTMLVAKRLFGSTTLAVLAGGLLAIDGNAIVLSRVSLLDTGVAFFALLGAYFVLVDRERVARRIEEWAAGRRATGQPIELGPVLWARPWLIAAALAFGCAASVKWNGLYFLAAFGLYTVVADAFLRKRVGIPTWGASAVLRQGPANFVLLVPLALVVYVASWGGWFATDGGYYRRWIESGGGKAWEGALAWVPFDVQNWWHYQAAIMNFHAGLTSEHSYQANPLTWLFLVRPTSMHYENVGDGWAEAILDIANPFLWWGATAALGYVLVRTVLRLLRGHTVTAEAFILTGIAAGYLPWLLYLHRTVFQFYTIAFEPFMVLALTAAIAAVAGSRTDPRPRRLAGLTTVGVYLAIVVLTSVFFWPLWSAQPTPVWFQQLHYWFRSWI
ncbi:phospholipid carrier-dependent glycosyltransferase [Protaetiibacter sp. SSC-01]|uniref:dolichyl-phosphate-mannose--protein mannosyltransferase n=1 Tax=Protaetiibacter sp. SSC-01 TaxID=2759943 RepID=UPI001656C781|nr:phospholipid carrier-dependent glycosyltransferase [Protaetiibacter sp. SSC-01]QNO38070.1 phospholipid carrier-dependent glycosyltransferase [Protaetiibacter sp. SSC-01]